VPFPQGRHVRPPNHKPMPSRAGDTAAPGECRNSVTPPTVVRLKAPRLRTASQSGAVAESSGATAQVWFRGNARRTRGGRLGASGIALAQFAKRIVTIAFQGQGEGGRNL
jgi:hypothetical protein